MKQFVVTDFGAINGAQAPQTDAIQAALDACFLEGGGEVVVPAGMQFVTGDIRIRSNTTLHLMENAVLLGSRNIADYFHINEDKLQPLPDDQNADAPWYKPAEWEAMGGGFKKHLYVAGTRWNHGLIRAVFAENVAVIGEAGSVIDGRNPFDPNGEEKYRGPHGINMHFCKNVTLRGYTMKSAGNWGNLIFQSENINVDHITVLAGHDAIHTRACKNVTIEGCKLVTGDDCVAGFGNVNVVVRNCEMSSACSAFRFGGYHVLIENCHAFAPCPYQFRGSFTYEEKAAGVTVSEHGRNNMLSFFTNFTMNDLPIATQPGKILIRNCTVENADRMLHLNYSGNERWQVGTPPTDVTFENVKVSGCAMGLTAYGVANKPLRIALRDVDYSCREGSEETPLIRAAYCNINLENVKVKGFAGDSLVRAWSDDVAVNANGLDCPLDGAALLVRADEEFVCKRI